MEVLGYQFSDKFEMFCEEQKSLLGLTNIEFLPITEHPSYTEDDNWYGTNKLTEDGKVLKVYLNHDQLNLHSVEERDYVAEVIAVHEILHQWTKTQGYPEVCADVRISDAFLNLFHHRVITRVMDKLGYDYAIPDRFVAQGFVEKNSALVLAEGLPDTTPI